MNLDDFKIGEWFWTATGRWLCIDKGTRFVLAIPENELLPETPLDEWDSKVLVFDKWDFGGCDTVDRFK